MAEGQATPSEVMQPKSYMGGQWQGDGSGSQRDFTISLRLEFYSSTPRPQGQSPQEATLIRPPIQQRTAAA
eukprot:3024896-Pyramimonas_sp.AAC.1